MMGDVYDQFRELIYARAGISLGDDKTALLRGRIRRRMQELHTNDFRSYYDQVTDDVSGEEIVKLLDAIATNHTFFFREKEHFAVLRKHVEQRVRDGNKKIRIWSAACSSGEEPYSMAMTLDDALATMGATDVDLGILATDISTRILADARRGEYSRERINGIPEFYRMRFLRPATYGSGGKCLVKDELKRVVTFRRLNLAQTPFPMRGPFDAIFCRNVMIYFDDRVRRQLINEFEKLLTPGGLLMVGMTETAIGFVDNLQYLSPSVYRKP